MFPVYLKLGFDHIADIKGYDHLLFLIALCAAYSYLEWKRILVLATAFTIGHSLTLALSALDMFQINSDIIEILIPVTILLTAIKNLVWPPKTEKIWNPTYVLPLFFGLIHGLGFSSFFRSLLGHEASVLLPLFAFNVGVEIGQICIIGILMVINFVWMKPLSLRQIYWNRTISLMAAILSSFMIFSRL